MLQDQRAHGIQGRQHRYSSDDTALRGKYSNRGGEQAHNRKDSGREKRERERIGRLKAKEEEEGRKIMAEREHSCQFGERARILSGAQRHKTG